MSSALVLGDHGSGVTTFIGLLYTAQVRYGIESEDSFRFHADRETIRMLQDIYGSIGDGHFPELEVDWERRPLSFILGFRRKGLTGMGGSRGKPDEEFDRVRIQVGGLPVEEIAELRDFDAVLDAPTRRLLRSPILIPLIDSTLLGSENLSPAARRIAKYDATLAKTLELLKSFLAAAQRKRERQLFPLFVATKFDQIDANVLRILHAPADAPTTWSQNEKMDLGQRLLVQYLPQTARTLVTDRHTKLHLASPVWFFTGVRTELSAENGLRIRRRLRIPHGGWEPEYPFEEFRSFIDRLGVLARRLPPGDEGN
jgi:hypothetical protein